MFKRFKSKLPVLILGTVLAALSAGCAVATRHVAVGFGVAPNAPRYYVDGYYDSFGFWHPAPYRYYYPQGSGYYDSWGFWHWR